MDERGNATHRHLDNNRPHGGLYLAAIVRFDLGEWLRHRGVPLPASFNILDLCYLRPAPVHAL